MFVSVVVARVAVLLEDGTARSAADGLLAGPVGG